MPPCKGGNRRPVGKVGTVRGVFHSTDIPPIGTRPDKTPRHYILPSECHRSYFFGAHCFAPVGLSDLSPCPLYASGGKPYGFDLAVLAAQPGGSPCVPAPWQQKKPLSAAPDNDFYSKSPCGDSCPMFAVVCSLRGQYNTQLFSLSSPLINNLPPFARGARAALPHVGSRDDYASSRSEGGHGRSGSVGVSEAAPKRPQSPSPPEHQGTSEHQGTDGAGSSTRPLPLLFLILRPTGRHRRQPPAAASGAPKPSTTAAGGHQRPPPGRRKKNKPRYA